MLDWISATATMHIQIWSFMPYAYPILMCSLLKRPVLASPGILSCIDVFSNCDLLKNMETRRDQVTAMAKYAVNG